MHFPQSFSLFLFLLSPLFLFPSLNTSIRLIFSSSFPSFSLSLPSPPPQTVVNSRTYVVTPKVRQAARDHFGCPTLVGAELESQGGSGTAGGHWAKRTLRFSYSSPHPSLLIAPSSLSVAMMS